ncbi:MAG: MFS transporter [Hyphomicrobiaceae bacterium]
MVSGFAWRLALFFGATFLITGVKVTYMPVWLDWRGLSGAEIGLIGAAPLFARIIAPPVVALFTDRRGDPRTSVIALAWASLVVMAGLPVAGGFWALLALALLLAVVSTAIMPLVETIAMDGVARHGLDYGRMRLWGSITFIVASFVAGVAVTRWGAGAVVWLMVAASAATALAAHLLPGAEVGAARRGAAGEASAGPPIRMVQLLRNRGFVLFLVSVGATQAAHAVFYVFGVLHWQRQGITPVEASLLWSVGVIAEIALFAVSALAVQRASALGLVLAGAAAALVRWTAMAFDPPFALLLALQAMHGLTFGAAHLGAVHLIGQLVPREAAATAQALYASVTSGIAMGLATLASGWLYPALGGRAYLAMAVLGAVGLVAGMLLFRVRGTAALR